MNVTLTDGTVFPSLFPRIYHGNMITVVSGSLIYTSQAPTEADDGLTLTLCECLLLSHGLLEPSSQQASALKSST